MRLYNKPVPCRSAREQEGVNVMHLKRTHTFTTALAFAPLLALPTVAAAATVANPLCPNNTAMFNPDNGKDIVVPEGFTVSVFASGLNMPTGIAFLGNSKKFQVYVLESGHGLPSVPWASQMQGARVFRPLGRRSISLSKMAYKEGGFSRRILIRRLTPRGKTTAHAS